MLRPIRLNPRLRDPLQLQQVAKYQGNLTVTSNDTNIVPRDDAGNVQLEANSQTNPLLIIEPVATRITLNSVLKVLDTQFQYFKFPATVRVIDNTEVDVDLTIPELDELQTQQETDIIYARYRPSENQEILSSSPGTFSGILLDFVEDGLPQKSTNLYQISKELKSSGNDIRIRFSILHSYKETTGTFGTAYFSIIKNSPGTGLNRKFKEYATVTAFKNELNATSGNENNDGYGYIKTGEEQKLTVDIILLNSEFNTGDYFSLGATAGQPGHTINAIQTYWVVTDASKNVDEWNQEIS